MNSNPIIQWLTEFVNRLGEKNPKFFNVIAWVGAAAALISKLPEALALLKIKIPDEYQVLAGNVWFYAGLVAVFIANLAVAKPVTGVVTQGTTTITDAEKLPFTATAELKRAQGEK